MCGILGVLSLGPSAGGPDSAYHVAHWRDRMAARGPDGAGQTSLSGSSPSGGWSATLAHRRLSIVEPGPAGDQPFWSPSGWVIVYNGELYNDASVRAEIGDRWRFRTRTDTETVLAAIATWGLEAASRLRGMYALAALNTASGELFLARDPLGIKPLFTAERDGSVFFASEARPAAEWAGHGRAHPDHAGIAAYLTTIRTTLGARTLFEGVRTLRAGEWATATPEAGGLRWRRIIVRPRDVRTAHAGTPLGTLLDRSVEAHLRSDVPLCCLLSGGLDSTAIATLASRRIPDLRTYCAGPAGENPRGEDFAWARQVADRLGLRHTEVGVTRQDFAAAAPDLIRRLGVPLSTPNEVAIHAVASAMRADGFKVTLSGEGADELFGGYDHVLAAAANHESMCGSAFACPRDRARHSATFWMSSHAWVGETALPHILRPDAADACSPRIVRDHIESAFLEIDEESADSAATVAGAVDRHLRYQRRVNLEGLLRRLDTATMLAGVEGRTPFADAALCAAAEELPAADKIRLSDRHGVAAVGPPEDSKIALRRALAGLVPEGVLRRPKASFPLPFEAWVADLMPRVMDSAMVRSLVRPEVLDIVAAQPSPNWRLAWPLVNLAVWGDTLTAKAPGFVEAAGGMSVPDPLAA
jgi:asparagine synthase (glutamine-hydrolysing)